MSAPRRRWISAAALGGEALGAAVVDRAERHAVVVDRSACRQREHLVAAGVGEDLAAPPGERVQPAELGDHVRRPGRR